jgi:hypothetical protein
VNRFCSRAWCDAAGRKTGVGVQSVQARYQIY